MSIIGSNVLAGASGSGVSAYEIEQSLRFNSSDSTNLSRTPGSTGNRKTFTVSCWVKRAEIGATQMIWSAGPASGGNIYLYFTSSDELQLSVDTEASGILKTTQKFRDVSAWYHIVCAVDTSQATAANRVKFFVNGTAVSDFASSTYPSQNHDTHWNHTSAHRIGQRNDGTAFYINAYIAEFYNLDGTAVSDAEDFAEADDNGVWRPIETSGLTFGTNGAYLKFDETATNGIGHDDSGNGNNWTASGFTTSGTATDVMSDTPTNNYMTLNPLDTSRDMSSTFYLDNGNLDLNVSNNSSYRNLSATFWPEGLKGYFEVTVSTGTPNFHIGFTDFDRVLTKSDYTISNINYHIRESGKVYNGPSAIHSSYLSAFSSGDTLGVAFDFTGSNKNVWFSKNGTFGSTSGGLGNPSTGANPALTTTQLDVEQRFYFAINTGSGLQTISLNAGQREFAHPPGTSSATDYFNTITYTGDGGTQSVTGCGFQPDLVWIKSRSLTIDHVLQDSVRGVSAWLSPNLTNGENTDTDQDYFRSFDSDGFTVSTSGTGSGSGVEEWNKSGATYVAWCWKAGGTASSNTDGTITSSVSANQDAGFSIVSYTGTGAGATVGHGLGVALDMYITKNRDATVGWGVYHKDLGGNTKYLNLNDTAAVNTSANIWNSTSPTSTVFSVGADGTGNGTGEDMIAYCFAEKTGVSKFGTYEGTSATNSIDVGFKPALVMIKNIDASSQWMMVDTERGSNEILNPNRTIAEFTASSSIRVNLTQSGFILNGNGTDTNVSGNTYIYAAFAENFSADADYKALNTANLPAPEIKDGTQNMMPVLWSGTGSARTQTGYNFQPDLLWIMKRNGSGMNVRLHDVVRGDNGTVMYRLGTNNTNNEDTDTDVTGLTSTGFTIGNDGTDHPNVSGSTYVGWGWKAAQDSGSSNTNGSITSTVSANAAAGFSIVGFEGNNTAGATVGHGLGEQPSMMIFKNRDNSAGRWVVYHSALGATKYIRLDSNTTAVTDSTAFNNTAPSSTTFTLGTNYYVNGDTENIIAYCFAEVENYSRMGSYIGNGSTDGIFIYTGFKVGWWMVKKDGSEAWYIRDTTRDSTNAISDALNPNATDLEFSYGSFDFLSNGIKIRESGSGSNTSGSTYIYAAFAENPFGGDGVSPATAR